METSDGADQPTPQQAQDALNGAERAEDAVRYPPIPAWFYPVMTVLMVAFILVQPLDLVRPLDGQRRTITVIIALAMVGLNVLTFRRAGISGPVYKFRHMLPMLAALLVTIFGAAILNAITELAWIWVVAALIGGTIVAVTGWKHQRFAKQAP